MVAESSDQGDGSSAPERRSSPIPASSPLKLLSELERGPHGILYSAQDARWGRPVSVRVPPRVWPQEQSLLAATRASSLEHPHIARVLEAGWREELTFIILGEELGASIQPGAVSPREAVIVIRDAATAVDYAGGRGMPHPGLVPDLLHFTRTGRVVLTGYELTGEAALPNPYRAPEVRDGGAVDAAANVYSLAAILYALISGHGPDPHSPQPPFQFDPRVPDDLEKPIRDAMNVDVKCRPSAATFAAALTGWLEMPETPPDALPQERGRGAWHEALVVTGLLALLTLWLSWPLQRAHEAVAAENDVAVRISTPPPELETAGSSPAELPSSVAEIPQEEPFVSEPAPAAEVEAATPPLGPKVEPPPPPPQDPTPPAPAAPALVGTVKYVHPHYGVFIALEAPMSVGVGDDLEAVREEGAVAVLKVRKLSRPEKLYPHGAAICDASDPVVAQGQLVRRPKP